MAPSSTGSSDRSTNSPRVNGNSPEGAASKRASDTRVVLLCDDDPFTCAGLSARLTAEGYFVVTTANVEDSLAVLRGCEVLAVIADLHLPGGADGTALLDAARRWYPSVLRFLLTADIAGSEIADTWYSTFIDKADRTATARLVEMLRGSG